MSSSNLYVYGFFQQDSSEFIASKLEELLALMVEVMHSCHISSKHHRLNCLYFLIVHVAKVLKVIGFASTFKVQCSGHEASDA